MTRSFHGATSEAEARRMVVETARAMGAEGLSPGRSGNVSCRWRDRMLVTPSGLAYDQLASADIVMTDLDGMPARSRRKPSSEWRLHAAIYRARAEAGAVVHCHSRYATALACARRPIPAFHYMVAVSGGVDIRCAGYATFGTAALAEAALGALDNRRACLLANHGQVAIGADPAAALDLAREVEALAAQYCTVLAIGGGHVLDTGEMAEVLTRFERYGQPE